jgi:hypothetical protein
MDLNNKTHFLSRKLIKILIKNDGISFQDGNSLVHRLELQFKIETVNVKLFAFGFCTIHIN